MWFAFLFLLLGVVYASPDIDLYAHLSDLSRGEDYYSGTSGFPPEVRNKTLAYINARKGTNWTVITCEGSTWFFEFNRFREAATRELYEHIDGRQRRKFLSLTPECPWMGVEEYVRSLWNENIDTRNQWSTGFYYEEKFDARTHEVRYVKVYRSVEDKKERLFKYLKRFIQITGGTTGFMNFWFPDEPEFTLTLNEALERLIHDQT